VIKPKPGTDPARALAYIATADGEVSPEIVARHLWPPTPRRTPFAGPADYATWRRSREDAERTNRDKASRILRRLAEAGYVEGRGGPRVAAWVLDAIERKGITRAIAMAAPGLRSPEDGPGVLHARLVRLVADTLPSTVAEVLGPKPSGRTVEVWADLCRWGVVIPASARYLTPKGADLVAAWETTKETA
jgi:hypothetical protein